MQRYAIGAIVAVAVATLVFRWGSPPTPTSVASGGIVVADLGPAKLRLVGGTTLDGGKSEPKKHIKFRLSFVNVGDRPLSLSAMRGLLSRWGTSGRIRDRAPTRKWRIVV